MAGFSTTGTSNANLYDPAAFDPVTSQPNSNGIMGQVDYTPWGAGNSPLGPLFNLRVGVQYTAYGKFNGARHFYTNQGGNAADNNALRIFTWAAF